MSEFRNRRHDAGMTLPEVLIAISVIGIIATVISSAIIVALRTEGGNQGRINVASAEQSVGVWLPADLASATDATTDPSASPCGGSICDGEALNGSNALMLSWPTGGTTTYVSYVYGLSDDGETYELTRVECTGGSCNFVTILRDLAGPDPAAWTPGVTPVPSEVINVALPLAADATDSTSTDATSSARRIVVTIDGGGGSEGAGGGLNRISITAGGTDLGTLEASKATGPSFLQARSRCGGPITIIVDDSGSIANDGASGQVETAVKEFVKALAGTPTSVQIIKFSTKSSLIDPTPDPSQPSKVYWNWYYDMTDDAVVDQLTKSGGTIEQGLKQNGGTNWEDAIYRTFYANRTDLTTEGRPYNLANDGDPTSFLPNLVVFFTDGEPTFNRAYSDAGSSYNGSNITSGGPLFPVGSEANDKYWPLATGNVFDQEGWNRSLYLLNPFLNREDIRVIGVGVGGIASNNVYSFDEQMLADATGRYGQHNGIVYRSGYGAYERYYTPSGSQPNNNGSRDNRLYPNVSAERALGNLIAGIHPVKGKAYVEATYSGGAWQNFDDTTDLLSTSDWGALGKALTTIALGECGGTVTLQTKKSGGALAQADVTYQVDLGTSIELVTTSQISRAAAVDMKFSGTSTQVTTTITPQDLDVSGYTATGWSCSSKGAPLSGSQWSIIDGDPEKGIELTVNANEAISCTMTVS